MTPRGKLLTAHDIDWGTAPTSQSTPFALTEAGAAESFAAAVGDRARYDHRRGRWLLWQAHRWAPDLDGGIVRLALAHVRRQQHVALDHKDRFLRQQTLDHWLKYDRRAALDNLLTIARALPPLADAGDWDTDSWLLGCPNGVVDLRTGQLRAGRPEDRITCSTTVAYTPTATSPRWDAALRSILVDDAVIGFVQAALGYCTTGDMRRDVWFLTQGPGRNGKGTVAHPVRRALGDYAAELPAAVFDARRDAAPYDLAILPGKRFVVSSEAGDTIRLHHDRIKQITGGDPVRAANKYERSFEFQPTCKLWLSANRKPRVTDDSPAFWARVMLVPFPVSFAGREDRDLRPALETDPEHQAAILAWLVRGAVRYAEHGLDAPETVRTATQEYERESDPLDEFLTDACRQTTDAEVGAATLFQHYRAWADTHGLSDRDERLSATAFGRRMSARFSSLRRRGGRVYLGVERGAV